MKTQTKFFVVGLVALVLALYFLFSIFFLVDQSYEAEVAVSSVASIKQSQEGNAVSSPPASSKGPNDNKASSSTTRSHNINSNNKGLGSTQRSNHQSNTTMEKEDQVILALSSPDAGCKEDDKFLCDNGAFVYRSGANCKHQCGPNSSTLYTELLWNAPLHSWTGVAHEAIDFLVPLSAALPNLALTGGYVVEYVEQYPESDRRVLTTLKANYDELIARQNHSEKFFSKVYMTQYDPGTYFNDYTRHHLDDYDYKIGRAMFETTWLPEGWVENIDVVDEVWVPSTWGMQQFVKAGVPPEKLIVVPESLDINVFDPSRVAKNPSLLPGSEGHFCFLSIFKWEDRKGWDVLLRAFLEEFTSDEKVILYIRSGEAFEVNAQVSKLVEKLKLDKPPKVVHVGRVAMSLYPALYASADAFVLPTRGEGWGRPLMEAMAMGLPTIATAWSGQTEFMSDDNSFLLPVDGFTQAYPKQRSIIGHRDHELHLWAKIADVSLSKIMRYVVAHPHIAKETGQRARQHIAAHYSREVVGEMIRRHLARIQRTLALKNRLKNKGREKRRK